MTCNTTTAITVTGSPAGRWTPCKRGWNARPRTADRRRRHRRPSTCWCRTTGSPTDTTLSRRTSPRARAGCFGRIRYARARARITVQPVRFGRALGDHFTIFEPVHGSFESWKLRGKKVFFFFLSLGYLHGIIVIIPDTMITRDNKYTCENRTLFDSYFSIPVIRSNG